MKNSGRQDRQARPDFEPGTSRLLALRAEPLGHWWRSFFMEGFVLPIEHGQL